jgi:fungal STAND N-terminal Goodbye domain
MTGPRSLSFSSHTIASSPSFQSVFNAALDEYTKHTGNDLTNHPLSIKVESCRSPGDVLGVLQEQAEVFREFREGNKNLMKVIEPMVNVLCSLSGVFSDNIGLVRPKRFEMAYPG